jgi:hypothetical protein
MKTYQDILQEYRKVVSLAKATNPVDPALVKRCQDLHNQLVKIEAAIPIKNSRSSLGNYEIDNE